MVAAITIVTFLVLILVLRALPLAAIAVGLNLLTVGVAFGVLTLLFDVPDDWPLGGHNYVDAVGATMIFGARLRPLDRLRRLPAQPHARALRPRTATTPPRSTSASTRPPA